MPTLPFFHLSLKDVFPLFLSVGAGHLTIFSWIFNLVSLPPPPSTSFLCVCVCVCARLIYKDDLRCWFFAFPRMSWIAAAWTSIISRVALLSVTNSSSWMTWHRYLCNVCFPMIFSAVGSDNACDRAIWNAAYIRFIIHHFFFPIWRVSFV